MNLIQFMLMVLPCVGIALYGFYSVFSTDKYKDNKKLILSIAILALVLAIGAFIVPGLSAKIYIGVIYLSCLAFATAFTIIPFLYKERIYAVYKGKEASFKVRAKTRYNLIFIHYEDQGDKSDRICTNGNQDIEDIEISSLHEMIADDTYTEAAIAKRFEEGEKYPVWIRPGSYKRCRIDRFADFPAGISSFIILVLFLIFIIWEKFLGSV